MSLTTHPASGDNSSGLKRARVGSALIETYSMPTSMPQQTPPA
jgi:hypothetical protein